MTAYDRAARRGLTRGDVGRNKTRGAGSKSAIQNCGLMPSVEAQGLLDPARNHIGTRR